jgi:predicted nuclease of predicted toxin-antitoxin system
LHYQQLYRMKLLLDENLPVKLKHRFIQNGIEAFTARDMQWLGKENGELLTLMIENNFTCFITIDQNNFIGYPIAVIVLVAHDNTYETIMEFFEKIISSIKVKFIGPKTVIHPHYKS